MSNPYTAPIKMNCKEIQQSMPFYLDGELQKNQHEAFDHHLMSCEGCALALHRFQQVWNVISTDRITEPDPFFYTRLMAKLEGQSDLSFRKILRLQPVTLALAVLIPLLAGIWLGYSLVREGTHANENTERIAELNNYLSTPGYASNDEISWWDMQ